MDYMLHKINIKKTNNPDKGYDDKDILFEDTLQHKEDVYKVMNGIAQEIVSRGKNHDWSKIEYFDKFAKDTVERQSVHDFKQREWYKIHTVQERHHINANLPEKINLIDILEFVCDCIVAGKARSGFVDEKFLIIPQDVLVKSYWNTVKIIEDNVVINDER